VYNVRGQLQARPFDPGKGEFLGQPSMIADGVNPGRWWYASTNGILAFRHNYGAQFQLSWVGRDGKPLGTLSDPGVIADPAISPDQKSIVFDRSNDNNVDLWTFDLARNNAARFTFEPGTDARASWSPDGKNIIYASQRNTSWFVVERPANGVGQEAILESNVGDNWAPASVSKDGKWLAVIEASPVHSVILLRSRGEPKKTVRIQEHESERDAVFSPDGRWLLYSTVPSSVREVLVQSVPKEAGGSATAVGKWQISTGGGSQPVWRADGKEIFYVARNGMMTAVPVEAGPDFFRPGTPKSLFQTRLEFDETRNGASRARQYDVTADGQRFLLNQHVTDAADAPINIVVNWPKLLAK
jgi:Tol biopolymer transport system component